MRGTYGNTTPPPPDPGTKVTWVTPQEEQMEYEKLPGATINSVGRELWVCLSCAALVASTEQHDAWHRTAVGERTR